MLDVIILGFLSYSSFTGYEIKKLIDTSTNFFWHAKLSQIYTRLKALESEEYISSILENSDSGPDKRVYSILPKGRNRFVSLMVRSPDDTLLRKDPFLVRVFFSGSLTDEQIRVILLNQRLEVEKELQRIDDVNPEIEKREDKNPMLKRASRFWKYTNSFGIEYYRMYQKWLETTLEDLENE